MAAGLRWRRFVGVLIFICALRAPAASATRLVVVPSHRTQAAQALQEFAQSLQKPLLAVAEVVPTSAYMQVAQKAQLGVNLASGTAAAPLVGRELGVSHVLYLRAMSEPLPQSKRRKHVSERVTVSATLVDVTTGESLLFKRYTLVGKATAANGPAATLVQDVQTALRAALPPLLAGQSSREGHQGDVPAPALPPADPGTQGQAAAAGNTATSQAVPQAAPTPSSGASPMQAPPADEAAAKPLMEAQTSAPFGLRAQLGLMIFARQSTLSSLGVPKLQYGVSRTGASPAFSRGNVQLEAFPVLLLRRHRPRRLVDGVGIHVGGALGWPKTRTQADTTATSLTSNLRLGLTVRYASYGKNNGPELALRLGYARYAFALPDAAAYPNLSYSSFYLSLGGIVPLGTPKVALMAEAALMPALQVGNQGALLGVHNGGGVGAWVEAGLRITPIPHLDVFALFDWEHYGAKFVGSTLLPNTPTQYASVGLSEVLLGGRLAVGTSF